MLAGADPDGEVRRQEQRVERVDVIGHQRMFIGLERRGDGGQCFRVVDQHGEPAWIWTIPARSRRSEEHTSELQSLMRISYAVFCLKKKRTNTTKVTTLNSTTTNPPAHIPPEEHH